MGDEKSLAHGEAFSYVNAFSKSTGIRGPGQRNGRATTGAKMEGQWQHVLKDPSARIDGHNEARLGTMMAERHRLTEQSQIPSTALPDLISRGYECKDCSSPGPECVYIKGRKTFNISHRTTADRPRPYDMFAISTLPHLFIVLYHQI